MLLRSLSLPANLRDAVSEEVEVAVGECIDEGDGVGSALAVPLADFGLGDSGEDGDLDGVFADGCLAERARVFDGGVLDGGLVPGEAHRLNDDLGEIEDGPLHDGEGLEVAEGAGDAVLCRRQRPSGAGDRCGRAGRLSGHAAMEEYNARPAK